jgi:HPt (histidine-containing phosphotransfer) domain-containing protein
VSTEPVLDPAVVAELRRTQAAFGNPAFISQLLGLFRTRAPGKMDQIREAFAAGDAAAIEQGAHALRSSCGMLGAMGMASAFATMEEAALRADLTAAATAVQDAERELPRVLQALSEVE